MKLSHKELEIQSGQFGEVRKLALEHQMQVGKFFDAQSFIEINQVHIMADTEALGLAGIEYLENLSYSKLDYPIPPILEELKVMMHLKLYLKHQQKAHQQLRI